MYHFDLPSWKQLQESARLANEHAETLTRVGEAAKRLTPSILPPVDSAYLRLIRQWADSPLATVSQQIPMQSPALHLLMQQTSDLLTAYKRLMEPAPAPLSPRLLDLAAVQIYTQTKSVETLVTGEHEEKGETVDVGGVPRLSFLDEIITQTSGLLEERLKNVGVPFYNMWVGALQAYRADNPDSMRQMMISLRTLLTELLKKLAPTEAVRDWDVNKTPEFWQGKEVQRKGQISYLCRRIKREDFSQFVQVDIDAVLSLISTLNQVHRPEINVGRDQLKILLERSHNALIFLFSIIEEEPAFGSGPEMHMEP